MSTFLVLRYVAFALFISFSSVISSIAALNIGSLAADTPGWPQVDQYLIFVGAFGLIVVFPVMFVELLRSNAFVGRVAFEIGWVALFWVMHLSGAAAVSALSCKTVPQVPLVCKTGNVLLAFTWLSTITLLTYLLGLVISTVYHHQEDRSVWHSGVRDYPWFDSRRRKVHAGAKSHDEEEDGARYMAYLKPAESKAPPRHQASYAQQVGLTASFVAEPLALERPGAVPAKRPAPIVSVQVRRPSPPPPPPPAVSKPSKGPAASLYPQHVQSAVRALPPMPAASSLSPQETLPRRKPRPLPKVSSPAPVAGPSRAPRSERPESEVAVEPERRESARQSTSRPKPSGPRIPSGSAPAPAPAPTQSASTSTSAPFTSTRRVRPPPLDLSRINGSRK